MNYSNHDHVDEGGGQDFMGVNLHECKELLLLGTAIVVIMIIQKSFFEQEVPKERLPDQIALVVPEASKTNDSEVAIENTEARDKQKDVSEKLDLVKMNVALAEWAKDQKIADEEERRKKNIFVPRSEHVGGSLRAKIDRFQIHPLTPSSTMKDAVCMHFRDAKTGEWWCWRWMLSNPISTTHLLLFKSQNNQWMEMSLEEGWKIARENKFPVPSHMMK